MAKANPTGQDGTVGGGEEGEEEERSGTIFSAAKDVELVQLQMITDDYRRLRTSSLFWVRMKNLFKVSSFQKIKLFLLNGAL